MKLKRNKGLKANRVYRMRSLRITGISLIVLYDLLAVGTIIRNPTTKTVAFQVVVEWTRFRGQFWAIVASC
jgi:hypothetical protein